MRKTATIVALLVILGLPVTHLWEFAVLVVGTTLVAKGTARRYRIVLPAVITLALAGIAARAWIPRAHIEEGHQFFLTEGTPDEVLARLLPPEVFEHLQREFLQQFPPDKWCAKATWGCWRAQDFPKSVFAFSADGVFQSKKYSRRVSEIAFDDLASFRAGFSNSLGGHPDLPFLNWTPQGSDIPREAIPFYVWYEISPREIGSALCWRGDVLWPSGSSHILERNQASACRTFMAEDVGNKIFATSVDPRKPLAMRFQPTPTLERWRKIEIALTVLLSIFVVGIAVQVQWREAAVPLALLAAAALALGSARLNFFAHNLPLAGGYDGLLHRGFGRAILLHALQGDWKNALLGVENVYYMMPGFRYVRALELLVFGDTHLGGMLVAITFPLALFRLLEKIVSPAVAAVLIGAYLIVSPPFLAPLGWQFTSLFGLCAEGLSDGLGYLLFLLVLERALAERSNFLTGLLLAASLFIRPNLVLGAAIVFLLIAWRDRHRESRASLLALALGTSAALVMLLHNFYLGGKLVLFTSASTIPENLFTSLPTYRDALLSWAGLGNFPEAQKQVGWQLQNWAGPWYRPLFFLCTAAFSIAGTWRLRWLALATLGLHVPLFFWHPSGRYSILAWLLSFMVTIGGLKWLTALRSTPWLRVHTRSSRSYAS